MWFVPDDMKDTDIDALLKVLPKAKRLFGSATGQVFVSDRKRKAGTVGDAASAKSNAGVGFKGLWSFRDSSKGKK